MGNVSHGGRFVSEGLDPRVLDTLTTAGDIFPGYDVVLISGVADRAAGTRNHKLGFATDVQLIDQSTGQPVPNYQNGPAFAIYERFAQTARVVQTEKYPELNNDFRWGGYFNSKKGPKGYGAVDLMHFDISPWMHGAMGLGSWTNGATSPALFKAYPGAVTNGGLRGANGDAIVTGIRSAMAGHPVPPSGMVTDPGNPAPVPAFRRPVVGDTSLAVARTLVRDVGSNILGSQRGIPGMDMAMQSERHAPQKLYSNDTPEILPAEENSNGGLDIRNTALYGVRRAPGTPKSAVPWQTFDFPDAPVDPVSEQLMKFAGPTREPGSPETGFNTVLSAADEKAFREWKQVYAPQDSGADYDLRGAFAQGLTPDPETGHWPDTFKKPNHPTFSDESEYAHYAPQLAGHWVGDTYQPPAYFDDVRERAASRLNVRPLVPSSIIERGPPRSPSVPASFIERGIARTAPPVPMPGRPAALDASTPEAQTIHVGKHDYTVGSTFEQGGFRYRVTPTGIEKSRIPTGEPTILSDVVNGIIKEKAAEAAPGVKKAAGDAAKWIKVKATELDTTLQHVAAGLGHAVMVTAPRAIGDAVTGAVKAKVKEAISTGVGAITEKVGQLGKGLGQLFAPSAATPSDRSIAGRGNLEPDAPPSGVRAVTVRTDGTIIGESSVDRHMIATNSQKAWLTVTGATHTAALPTSVSAALAGTPFAGMAASIDAHFSKPDAVTADSFKTLEAVHEARDVVVPAAPKVSSTVVTPPKTVKSAPTPTSAAAHPAGTGEQPASGRPAQPDPTGGWGFKLLPTIAPKAPQVAETSSHRVLETVVNPAYTTWEKTFGTGGANQTLVDVHDRRDTAAVAASQGGLNIASHVAAAAAPPPPPKTVTRVTYQPAPAPAPAPVQVAARSDASGKTGGWQQPSVTIASGKTVPVGTTGTAQGGKLQYQVLADGSVMEVNSGRITSPAPSSGGGGNSVGTHWDASSGSWQGGGQ